jgi:hypothetical protein
MDLGSLTQLASSSGFSLSDLNSQLNSLSSLTNLASGAGLRIPGVSSKLLTDVGLGLGALFAFRLLSPLIGGLVRTPVRVASRAVQYAARPNPYQISGYRGLLAPGGGSFGGLFSLGAWASAACALVLLLSPQSGAHPLIAGSALGPVLLFFAASALLSSLIQCGGTALRMGLWAAVCLILYKGPVASAGLNSLMKMQVPSISQAYSTAPTRVRVVRQDFDFSKRAPQAVFQQL